MAILAFQKPDKLVMLEGADAFTARFEFKPLEPGFGITIGNALRRILLSSIEGYAIASIRIDGVDHEFATIPGVMEDVTNIILNLKKVRLKPIVENALEERITLTVAGRDAFKAGDLNVALSNFEVVNKDLMICRLSKDASFTIDIRINKGRGYVPAEENKIVGEEEEEVLNIIPIDSIYTPIQKVMYRKEDFRVEQKTDYEKLIIELATDGTIDPKKAMQDAATILIEHFALFADDKNLQVQHLVDEEDSNLDRETRRIRQLLLSDIDECDLSVRARNCLTSNGVKTLAALVSYDKTLLMKFRNFGKKTLEELSQFLDDVGLDFDMDLSKYNLYKD